MKEISIHNFSPVCICAIVRVTRGYIKHRRQTQQQRYNTQHIPCPRRINAGALFVGVRRWYSVMVENAAPFEWRGLAWRYSLVVLDHARHASSRSSICPIILRSAASPSGVSADVAFGSVGETKVKVGGRSIGVNNSTGGLGMTLTGTVITGRSGTEEQPESATKTATATGLLHRATCSSPRFPLLEQRWRVFLACPLSAYSLPRSPPLRPSH